MSTSVVGLTEEEEYRELAKIIELRKRIESGQHPKYRPTGGTRVSTPSLNTEMNGAKAIAEMTTNGTKATAEMATSFEAPRPIPSWNDSKKQHQKDRFPSDQQKSEASKPVLGPSQSAKEGLNGHESIRGEQLQRKAHENCHQQKRENEQAQLRIPREHVEERKREVLNHVQEGQRKTTTVEGQDVPNIAESAVRDTRRSPSPTRKNSTSQLTASNIKNVDNVPAGSRDEHFDSAKRQRNGPNERDQWRNPPPGRRNYGADTYPSGPTKNNRGRRGGPRGGAFNNRHDENLYDPRRRDGDWDRRGGPNTREQSREYYDGFHALPYDDVDDRRASPVQKTPVMKTAPTNGRGSSSDRRDSHSARTERSLSRARDEQSSSPGYEPPDAVEPAPAPIITAASLPTPVGQDMDKDFLAPQPIRKAESKPLEDAAAQREEEEAAAAHNLLSEPPNPEQLAADPVKAEVTAQHPVFASPRVPMRESRPESPVVTLPRPTPTPQLATVTNVEYFSLPATTNRHPSDFAPTRSQNYLEAPRPDVYPAERNVSREDLEYAHARDRLPSRLIYVDAYRNPLSSQIYMEDGYGPRFSVPPPRRYQYEQAPPIIRPRSPSPPPRMRSRSPRLYPPPAEPEDMRHRRRSSRSLSPTRQHPDPSYNPEGYRVRRSVLRQPTEARYVEYINRPIYYEDYYPPPMLARDRMVASRGPLVYYESMEPSQVRYHERPIAAMDERRYYERPVPISSDDRPYERRSGLPPPLPPQFAEPEPEYYERRPLTPLPNALPSRYVEQPEHLSYARQYRERDYPPSAVYSPMEDRRAEMRYARAPPEYIPQGERPQGERESRSYSRAPPEFEREPLPRAYYR